MRNTLLLLHILFSTFSFAQTLNNKTIKVTGVASAFLKPDSICLQIQIDEEDNLGSRVGSEKIETAIIMACKGIGAPKKVTSALDGFPLMSQLDDYYKVGGALNLYQVWVTGNQNLDSILNRLYRISKHGEVHCSIVNVLFKDLQKIRSELKNKALADAKIKAVNNATILNASIKEPIEIGEVEEYHNATKYRESIEYSPVTPMLLRLKTTAGLLLSFEVPVTFSLN